MLRYHREAIRNQHRREMGNYKFRLSDMIPNAWFYKLRDMSNTRNTNSHPIKKTTPTNSNRPNYTHKRPSHYYSSKPITPDKFYNSPQNPKFSDTQFPDPHRKSSKRRPKRKTIYKPSPIKQETFKPELTEDQDCFYSSTDSSPEPQSSLSEYESTRSLNELTTWSSTCSCRVSSSTNDIIIDMKEKSHAKKNGGFDEFDVISEIELPPILTKPPKFNHVAELEETESHIGSLSIKIVKENSIKTQKEVETTTPVRKSISHSTGVKLRTNSPRLASKKIQVHSRKSASRQRKEKFAESFAIVKSSFDPERDFMESMMEMIVENNIRAAKDLEELLACYLSLNSDEYHDLIVKAFEQIWFNLPNLNM